MRIALDAMGSDNAPGPEVRGAIEASLEDEGLEIVLVGDQDVLHSALSRYTRRPNIVIRHAPEVITMEDSPVQAVRRKKDSSLMVAMRMAKAGEVDGVVSAGNTGALQVASRIVLGPISGVARSALGQRFPTLTADPTFIVDLGANVDCSARHLCEFAEMGAVYVEHVLGVKNPKVGLINIGAEQIKGNELVKSVHRNLMATPHINFVGNVEPRGIYAGEVNVAVCDGFIGNLVLKSSEATANFVQTSLKREMMTTWLSRLGGMLCLPAFRRVKAKVNPNDLPGAPLLGVNGIVIKVHGGAEFAGIKNAILGASKAVACHINDLIREQVVLLRAAEASFAQHADSPALAPARVTAAAREATLPAATEGSTMPAFLFPGQGSQAPGMGRDFYDSTPELRAFFDKAEACVPGLLSPMFGGPPEALAKTRYAQVALLTVESAINFWLRKTGHEPEVCAGHSLGEFSALVCAEALSFEEALRLVEARGRCMSENVPEGGMAAVLGMDSAEIEALLPEGAYVANYNGPMQTIISGGLEALAKAEENFVNAGARRLRRLAVSGPFHSPLMAPAAAAFAKVLAKADFKTPKYKFVSSVTGEETSDPEAIRSLLAKQICSAVRWTDVMATLGPRKAFEIGPGSVLQGLAKRMKDGPQVLPIGTLEAVNAMEAAS